MNRLLTLMTVAFAVAFAMPATVTLAAPVGDPNVAGTTLDTAIKDSATQPSAGKDETTQEQPAKMKKTHTRAHKKTHKKTAAKKGAKKGHHKKHKKTEEGK